MTAPTDVGDATPSRAELVETHTAVVAFIGEPGSLKRPRFL